MRTITLPPLQYPALCLTGLLLLLAACQSNERDTPPGFEIHPEFQLELAAAEPMVFDPVDLEFDARGRAFVLEMPGYPLRDEDSRLILLKDEDGDGRYDRRHIYADTLGVASSFMPYRGGMLVAAPPKLIWLRDQDGDDVADQRIALMNGFSAGNLQHNFNGLSYGLDNWIYAANGGNSGQPFFVNKPEEKIDMRGDDFRFRLEGEQLERVGKSSGGFELAFDQWGRMYETHNLRHVSQLVFEGRYLEGLPTEPSHTLTVISDHEENGLSRIYPIGEQETRVNHPEQSGYFSGSCGITFYGGGAFPNEFNDQLFVADVVLNLVHLDLLSPDGAAMKASRNREKVEFLASTDRAFRPVNMTVGPDGALYLLDMHRVVIEHPEWIPDEIEVGLDLSAGKEKGRIYRIRPRQNWTPLQPKLDENTPGAWVAALESENQWARLTAQRLIVETQNKDLVPQLKELADASEHPLARLHALWTLEGLNAMTPNLIDQGLTDPVAGVREHALKIAEIYLDEHPELTEAALRLTSDTNARVRMQAALTVSTLPAESYAERAEAIAAALTNMLDTQPVDRWTAMAIAGATKSNAAAFCSALLEQARDSLSTSKQQVLQPLFRLTGRRNELEDTQTLLRAVHNTPAATTTDKALLIEALAEGWRRSPFIPGNLPPDREAMNLLANLEQTGEPAILRASGQLRQALGWPVSSQMKQRIDEAMAAVKDPQKAADERLALLKLIALADFQEREEALYALLDNRAPVVLQKEALSQLWSANETSVGPKLVALWPELGPQARRQAGNILLYKSFNHDRLLTALENGRIRPGEMNFDLERRRTLLFSDDENIRRRAEALFSDAGVVTRKEAMEQMRPALALNGNLVRGQALYEETCAQCHRYGQIGEDVGPVLTEISRKSKESLLHDIVDPNAAVDTKYLSHQIRTKDGNIYSGMIYAETDDEITLKMAGGAEQVIDKDNIESLSSLGISLMPEGQERDMSHQDMADLLAFLQQEIQ